MFFLTYVKNRFLFNESEWTYVTFGEGSGPLVVWCTGAREGDETEELCRILNKEYPAGNFRLLVFPAENWNRDFSPWEAPAVFGAEAFSGGGRDTLGFLQMELLPEFFMKTGVFETVFIAGYSLAGLFSLWALYETDLFSGAASCSGSLWFPGWESYRESIQLKKPALVYLSLGIKEEKTKNSVMASVGDRTRKEFERLIKDPGITDSLLEWQPGGHFNEPLRRTAKGILWLIRTGPPS